MLAILDWLRSVPDYFTPAEWVQVAVALGTLAAAFVGWRAARAARAAADVAEKQLPELRAQAEATSRQADAAQKQLELARQTAQEATAAARESARARADQQAPQVILAVLEPEWPPYVDRERHGMPYANELRLLDPGSTERATRDLTEFYLSEHGDWLMWFRGRAYVINEGRTSARVRVSGEVLWSEGRIYHSSGESQPEEFAGLPVWPATPVGDRARHEYLVPPGAVCKLYWALGCTIREWAEKHDAPHAAGGTIFTDVFSFVDNGTLDRIKMDFAARPLAPGKGGKNHWVLVDDPADRLGITIYPAKREYSVEREGRRQFDHEEPNADNAE